MASRDHGSRGHRVRLLHRYLHTTLLTLLQMESLRILRHLQSSDGPGATRVTMGQYESQSAAQNFDSAASEGTAGGQEDVETNVDANTET